MPCPVCGEICRCSCNEKSAERTANRRPAVERQTTEESLDLQQSKGPEGAAWRQEIAARLNRYQARRKPRPPRYPSLRLPFEPIEPADRAVTARLSSPDCTAVAAPVSTQVSHSALALDGFAQIANPIPAAAPADGIPVNSVEAGPIFDVASPASAKIIEFPRPWIPPVRPADELAEPVITSPRILEVPEFVPPAPALGGITIEPTRQLDIERRLGIDFPLQSASLARRIFAAALDAVVVAMAGFAFGFIFWNLTAIRPPRLQTIEMMGGFAAVFWAAYQYLLIVYSGSTPGLRLAGLELSRFDGTTASRRLRQWRVLASFLSATSLGMGYAWVLLDEDALCWHDRITHTYLGPKKRGGDPKCPGACDAFAAGADLNDKPPAPSPA